MTCFIDKEIERLKTDDEFKSWILKIKERHPDRSDEDVENELITFMQYNNGNFPGINPFGNKSKTFEELAQVYDDDEVRAFEVYELLFGKDFIDEFGNWCDGPIDTEGLTEEQKEEKIKDLDNKLLRSVRNEDGEPVLMFVNSVNHLSGDSSTAATNKLDINLQFKLEIKNGEARVTTGYDRPVQNGSITFVVAKNVVVPVSGLYEIHIDMDDVDKMYDINSDNKGFTEKRIAIFLSQSSKDLYYVSKKISEVNSRLKSEAISGKTYNKLEAIDFIKNNFKDLVFDTDESSPFGHIQIMPTAIGSKRAWLIVSTEGIFYGRSRFAVSQNMSEKSQTDIDRLANMFFINRDRLDLIKKYIDSKVLTVKPDSHLQSPIVDFDLDHFILKPSFDRTQHNIKTEFGMAYAVYMYKERNDKFEEYLRYAKLFSEIRQNSAGEGVVKDVNTVGNLIGFILSGQLIDKNYYTAHMFDQTALKQALFVSRNHKSICKITEELWKDMMVDIPDPKMRFLTVHGKKNISEIYNDIDFSDIVDDLFKNREVNKLSAGGNVHSFCDTIDRVKALYTYRRNDSGSRKAYDATEYTKVAAMYEQLNQLNKDIKEYLIDKNDGVTTMPGESIIRLVSDYINCIDTIINIMDQDISVLEDFIWNTPEKYTPEYYSQLLYLDRSIIKMYKNSDNNNIMESLFNLDSEDSDLVQKTLYDIFNQQDRRKFEKLRDKYYDNYLKLSSKVDINHKKGSLDHIISNMIDDAVDHIVDKWCNDNLKCLTQKEESLYRENLKLDLRGHIDTGTALDLAIGGAASSGHNIINVLYRIIQTQANRSNLLIKQKGDSLLKEFKSVFNTANPFNQCKKFCEMVNGKTSGYFIRDVNYGLYYRAKVKAQKELLDLLPPVYTIDRLKSTETKLFIEWAVGSEEYQTKFLNDMDRWIEKNANRRYNADYYIERRRILGKSRKINGHTVVVGNEAANRQNTLRRQIDGIKNRYRDKETKVFLPFKVPPVQKKILESLEQLLSDLSSPYERYTNEKGERSIREKTGLDLAIALNIQDWNKYILEKRKYSQDTLKYEETVQKLKGRLTKEQLELFEEYYHREQPTQEYYDILEEKYGGYGEYQEAIDDIHFRRKSILSRVKHGKKGLFQFPNLNELTPAEWEELKQLDIREDNIKSRMPSPPVDIESITGHFSVTNEKGESFLELHKKTGEDHTFINSQGEEKHLSVYWISAPLHDDLIEDVLIGEFSKEESDYINPLFDQSNTSYELPRAYEYDPKTKTVNTSKKLYKNDKYEEIKNNKKLFHLYETFLNMMQEANEMFGYAAISSNYKLPQIYEREASVYISRGCSLLDSIHYQIKRDFLIDERDLDRSYTSDVHADNTTSGKLRKRFVEMLSDPEHISTDLVYSVMAYYTVACRYSDKQDIQAQCELINRKINSEENTNKPLKVLSNNVVETFLFENTMNTNNAVAAGVEKFMEHTTVVMLKWKLKTAIKAFLDGYRLLTNAYLSDKWNMRGHFLDATSKAIAQTFGFGGVRSSIDLLDYNLSEALMSLNEINIQSYMDANKTKFTRAYYKSGLMPTLTAIDHITTKSITLAVYDSIRLYTHPDGRKEFLNIEEFINQYKLDYDVDDKTAEEKAGLLFWGKKGNDAPATLYDAYLLKDNILSIKDEYKHMFSNDEKVNEEQWAIIQTRVQGQINLMAAAINGFKPEDTRSANVLRSWYLKPIFLIRSFLISNYNEIFKHSPTLKRMQADTTTKNTRTYRPERQYSENKMANRINKWWSTDNGIVLFLNAISSEQEMYNVLTGTKDVGHFFGIMSFVRKHVENIIIYFGSVYNKEDPEYRKISNIEKVSIINAVLVCLEALLFYNTAVFIGGLLCCLLGQGSDPDDEDEWFVHWFLWTLYDISGSMFNDTLVNLPTGDTLVDIFKNIMAVVPVMQLFKKSLFDSKGALTFVEALFGDDEMFENPEYGTNESVFNLIKSGKWLGEMYGKRMFYETVQNAPWLIAPWWLLFPLPIAWTASRVLPPLPIANLKESFSAHAAKAKASYTFNNLSPVDYTKLKTPSSSLESYDKFHDYNKASFIANILNSLVDGPENELEIVDFIRNIPNIPYSPVPNMSPVDKVERSIPLGREYN